MATSALSRVIPNDEISARQCIRRKGSSTLLCFFSIRDAKRICWRQSSSEFYRPVRRRRRRRRKGGRTEELESNDTNFWTVHLISAFVPFSCCCCLHFPIHIKFWASVPEHQKEKTWGDEGRVADKGDLGMDI